MLLFKRYGASSLVFILALEPKVDVPHDVEHEHFSIVALRANQEVAEVLNFVFAVGDRHVFAGAGHVDVQPAARFG